MPLAVVEEYLGSKQVETRFGGFHASSYANISTPQGGSLSPAVFNCGCKASLVALAVNIEQDKKQTIRL